MARSYEMRFSIGGNLSSSFSNSFNRANSSLTNLRNQTRQTQTALNRLGNDFRNGRILEDQYRTSTERLTRELERLERTQKRINTMKTSFGQGMEKAKQYTKYAALGTAAAATGVAYSSMKTAASFEQQMSKVGAISGASATELGRLNAEAQNLGKSTVFTATQAGEGMEYLALAGWKTNNIISAMPGMLNLAAAGSLDLGRAADITSDTMQAFGMSADKATHAADVYAYAQANANTNVEQMGEALKYSAPAANSFGWSLEETSAATMAFANSGLKGSIAGQAFASSLTRLAKPTTKMGKMMKKTNSEFFTAEGTLKSMPDLVKELEKATKKMTQEQRAGYLATLFGAEAYKHWAILLETGSDKLRTMTSELENADGTAARMSAKMVDNYSGSLMLMQSSFEAAQIKFATPILPVFKDLFDGISDSITNNIGTIEKAGEKVGTALRDVLDPFLKKPEWNMDIAHDPEQLKKYQEQLAKYNKFGKMDFGDKVVYSLDEASEKIENWVSGPGGDSMNKIFTKFGEIAAKAWASAFTGAVKSAGSNLVDGNFASAGGMGALAWILGGGVMVKGAMGAGKWGYGKFKERSAPRAVAPQSTAGSQTNATQSGRRNAASRLAENNRTSTTSTTNARTAGSTAATNGGKGLLKRALGPLGQFFLLKEAADGGDSLYDWAFGHKQGDIKQKGLFSNPFDLSTQRYDDTRIGAIPKFFGFGGTEKNNNQSAAAKSFENQPNVATAALTVKIDQATDSFATLAKDTSQSSSQTFESFKEMKISTDLLKRNLDLLTDYTGQASGWLASLNNIQSAGQRVVQALNNLEARINTVQLPGVNNKRVSYDG